MVGNPQSKKLVKILKPLRVSRNSEIKLSKNPNNTKKTPKSIIIKKLTYISESSNQASKATTAKKQIALIIKKTESQSRKKKTSNVIKINCSDRKSLNKKTQYNEWRGLLRS